MTQTSIGFIGTGRIARAMISGLSRNPANTICGYDRQPETAAALNRDFGITNHNSPGEVLRNATIIVLAVKPYQISEVLDELRPSLTGSHLLISVAAGITSEFIRRHTLDDMRVVRVMPNTPAFSGEGMTALSKGIRATDHDMEMAAELFRSIGRICILEESQMDAATAVSGSGPAYMFAIIDAMSQGGQACGLSEEQAILLSAQTMLGAATMVLEGAKNPRELISDVTTPGGTTEAGLKQLEAHDIRQTMIDTVRAAAERSKELKQ
ncbi:MAG: pyrroline-5-carboxylate reductase [Prosthecochloris sp.]|nr:pyrroline-5-carboxylate reductase [Prosthecochloris sp.]